MSLNKPTAYFIAGQVGWFAAVISAADRQSWIGVAVVVVLLAAHAWLVRRPAEEFAFVLSVTVMGYLWETVMVRAGLLSYPSSRSGLAPYWIGALWALFAAQFNTTYRWLKSRIGLASLLGAVAGPASFRAGASLGALTYAKPVATTVTLAAGWACLLPLIVLLSRWQDGVQEQKGPPPATLLGPAA